MTNVIKMSKKAFTWSVVLTTILWSMGVAALIPAGFASSATIVSADDIEAGDLIQRLNDTTRAVYYITEDMERMYFPNAAVFNTWFANFDDVKIVDADFDEMWPPASQSVVAPRPGSDVLFKTTASARVYAMGIDNKRYHIANEAAAAALFGSNWATKVLDWPDYVMSGWTIAGEQIDSPYDGYVAKEGDTYYQFNDDMWDEVTGTVPNFVGSMEYTNFSDYEISGDTTTAASLTADPSQGGAGGATTTPVNPGSVSIKLAGDTPDSDYVYYNSTHNQFTKVNFTAGNEDVTINSFVVERQGAPASDAAFSGINVLLEDGTLLSNSYKTINSSHQVTFTEDLVIPANKTVSIILLGKMANLTTKGGEVPKLALASVDTDASVTASLPIVGNSMTVNTTVTIGVATVSESPDLGILIEEVGTTDVEFLNVKIENGSASSIDLWIKSIRFNNAGSADDTDVENLELVVDGDVVAEGKMENNYVYFDLSEVAKAKIVNGKNETFTLRGDIIGGSGRTLDFDIKKADDIFAYDLLNKAYTTPSAAIDSGRTISISRGTLNVSKTNTVLAGNIPEDTTDLEFGSWNFKVQGEPITINSLAIWINGSGAVNAADFTQMKLVNSDGKALTGTFDGVGATNNGSVTSTDSFTLPEGDNEIKLIGKLNSDPNVGDYVEFSIDLAYTAGLDATGDVTGDAITVGTYAFPNAKVTANRQTITAASLTVTTLSSPPASTIAAGSSQQQFSTISISGSASSEDIKISAFSINVTTTAAETNQIQNITFKVNDTADGSYRTLATTKNGSGSTAGLDELITVTLPTADHITVKKGTTVTMKIYADVSASCSSGDKFQIHINNVADDNSDTGVATVTSEGVLTGVDVTEVYSAAEASVMTVGAAGGQLEVALSSDTPNAQIMAADTDVTLASFRFLATTTEDVELDYLYLTQVSTVSASTSYKDYDYIWFEDKDGNEIPGTRMSPTSTKPYIDFTDEAFVVEADGSAEVLYLKANLAPIGSCASLTCTGENGTPGHQLGYKINSAASDVVATGHSSGVGSTEYAGTTAPTGKTHYVYKSYPVVTKQAVSTNKLANGTRDLYKFTVSAVNGDVGLGGFTFDIATTTASITQSSCYLYDVTDSSEEQINETGGCGATSATKVVSAWYSTGIVFQMVAHGDDWDTTQTVDEIVVSPNQPRTFVLRANVTAAATGASISTGLAGDSATMTGAGGGATNMLAAATVDGVVHDDFIWSDMNDNGHTDATTDWTNGYLVSGLSSSTSTLETLAF